MSAFCPFNHQECFKRCNFYSNGCLIRQALETYVVLNTSIEYEYDFENDLKLKPRADKWAGQMSISSQWGDR